MALNLSPIGNGVTFPDVAGRPLAGGLLWTYLAGSTTPIAAYTDPGGTIPHTNPIILGPDGRPPMEIWLMLGVAYKFVLQDASGVPIPNATYDNIPGILNNLPWATAAAFPVNNNLIIGDMQVWQRGVDFLNVTTANFYTADRWGANRAGDVPGLEIHRKGYAAQSPLTDYRYDLWMRRTPGDTSTAANSLWYTLETQDSYWLAGRQVTFSIRTIASSPFSGGNLTLTLYSGTGTDQRVYAFTGQTPFASAVVPVSTVGTVVSVTGFVPANCMELGLQISWTPQTTAPAGTDDSVLFGGPWLNLGAVPMRGPPRLWALELALCERYYGKSFSYATAPAQNIGSNAGAMIFTQAIAGASVQTAPGVWYKVTKRVAPTVTLYNPLAANGQIRNESAGNDWTGTTIAVVGDTGFQVIGTPPVGSVQGSTAAFHWSADAEL